MHGEITHWVAIDGRIFPYREYSNHGYGGKYRGRMDLPKDGYPYGVIHAEKKDIVYTPPKEPMVIEGVVTVRAYGGSLKDGDNLTFTGTWEECKSWKDSLNEGKVGLNRCGMALVKI